ncbi:MAG TPA: Nif3-like dinuclear metal center hexameric protein [Vicinamibacteria bacterium]|nr:Nif3-like dinuclear metal center hexameric protein [Vicinamibacteria bacterium]
MTRHPTRRSFLAGLAAGAGSLARPLRASAPGEASPTVGGVIEGILAAIPGAPRRDTVDVFKAGDPSRRCTGVVTTFLATLDVLRKAAGLGANLVIAHEPVFYNHLDETAWLSGDRVYEAKRRFIEEGRLVVWRAHDSWHALQPDPVTAGTLKALGWERLAVRDAEGVCEVPPTPVASLAASLKEKLGSRGVRFVGDPGLTCHRVGLSLGAAGGESQIRSLRRTDVDALVVGELHEWETSEYVRDSGALGWPKAVIVLGHAASEEAGMRELAEWLRPRFPALKVTHVPAGDAFTYV